MSFGEAISPAAVLEEPLSPKRRSGLRIAVAQEKEVLHFDVGSLKLRSMVRLRPLDAAHRALLAEIPDRWPPILVEAATQTVIDGAHRLAAARQLGLPTIAGRLFHGDENEAFARAVQENTAHGLPLTMAERIAATRRLLAAWPDRSDRAIAEVCGVDHKTVGRLRKTADNGDTQRGQIRLGRDNRARPLDPAERRERIAKAIDNDPGASLRSIARQTGASPETVRGVRARLAQDRLTLARRSAGPIDLPVSLQPVPMPVAWEKDSACSASESGADFATWIDAAASCLHWCDYVDTVPISRIYEVADQARSYADAWTRFAESVELRVRHSR